MRECDSIKRPDFIKRLMQDVGLSYDMATAAYLSMVSLIGDGMARNQRICLGKVCNLQPKESPPRKVRLGQKLKKGGGYEKVGLTFYIDRRVRYQVRIHREYIKKKSLNLF
jgi:hypothetical protein